jgi:asparagine synthase (glutamine-hydrolysing)
MCGIVGMTYKEDEHRIERALNAMKHRGQDGVGVYADNAVSLGHVRLSVIDLANVSYPIHNEDQSIYAVVNGEFYDFVKIREELMSRGHKFYTSTDAEILVHLYEEKGLDAVKELNGEFAFLLHDKNSNRLIAGRDRFGIKPLHYSVLKGEYLFASEVKALVELGVTPEIDKESLIISSSMQYCLPSKTIFNNVNHILPGHMMIVDLDSKYVRDITYWDMDFTDGDYTSSDIHDLLVDAVKTRMTSDVPVCCALSGGLDSSLVYGIANQFKKTNAVTVSVKGSGFDESEIAERTVRHYNTNLDVLDLTSENVISTLSDAVYMSEGLTINSHLPAKFMLSKLIKDKGYKVVLTGEGADELFCGYPHFKQDLGIDYASFKEDNRVSNGVLNNYDTTHAYLQGYDNLLGFTPNFLKVKSSFGLRVKNLLDDGLYSNFDMSAISTRFIGHYNAEHLKSLSRADSSAYLWTKLVLSNYMLRTLADGTEMAHTVEGRVPFLDHRLFDAASKIPVRHKVEGVIEKKILRNIGKPYITEEVYNKVKQPFITPPLLLLERDFLYDHVSDLPDFVDKQALRDLLGKLYTDNNFDDMVKHEPVLYYIYSLMFLMTRFNAKLAV